MHRANPVHGEAVKERKAALKALISRKNEAFRKQFLGSELPVVTLTGGDSRFTEALSDNFLRVSVSGRYPANQRLRVWVEELTTDGLAGAAVRAS
jgi:tRNA A37 methylthiotransferase MiaB